MKRYIRIPEIPFAWTGWIVAAILLVALIFSYSSFSSSYSPMSMPPLSIGGDIPGGGFVPGVGGGPPTNPNEPSTSQVDLQAVPIQKMVNSRVIWAGLSDSEKVLLVLNSELIPDSQISSLHLSAGDKVNITALVKASPDAPTAQKKWGLSEDDANSVVEQQYYLLVSHIEPGS